MSEQLRPGDVVILESMPEHYFGDPPLTVGNKYTILLLDGSNVCTTSDVAGCEPHYSRGRVRKVSDEKSGCQ